MQHRTINSGSGSFHEVIAEFDESGRVIVATAIDVALYESLEAYESGEEMPAYAATAFGEAIEEETEAGYVRSLVDGEEQFTVNHVLGCSLHVTKDPTR